LAIAVGSDSGVCASKSAASTAHITTPRRNHKAGSDLIFQMHYTANGKPAKDRTRIGIVFAKEPPSERIYTITINNMGFKIPPGDPNYPVEASITLQENARIVALNPHSRDLG
jgi:hypothetical protein